jgi:hypothetical protein
MGVGYFKPGDRCTTHTGYVKETGQIWFGCKERSYVAELKPELRKDLGFLELRANQALTSQRQEYPPSWRGRIPAS